jgi:hypothetical protein
MSAGRPVRTGHHPEEHRREDEIGQPGAETGIGSDGNLGEQLGLTKDWVVRIVKGVGNYGELSHIMFVPSNAARRRDAEGSPEFLA